MAHVRIFTRLNINGKYFCIWLDFQLSSFHEMMKLLSRSVKTDANFSVISYWDNKQQRQAQSDRCKMLTDGVPISSNHPSIWKVVQHKWCKFKGLWLLSTNVDIRLSYAQFLSMQRLRDLISRVFRSKLYRILWILRRHVDLNCIFFNYDWIDLFLFIKNEFLGYSLMFE